MLDSRRTGHRNLLVITLVVSVLSELPVDCMDDSDLAARFLDNLPQSDRETRKMQIKVETKTTKSETNKYQMAQTLV